MVTAQPDLSLPPASGYVAKLAVMTMRSIAPGRTAEYEKSSKEAVAY